MSHWVAGVHLAHVHVGDMVAPKGSFRSACGSVLKRTTGALEGLPRCVKCAAAERRVDAATKGAS